MGSKEVEEGCFIGWQCQCLCPIGKHARIACVEGMQDQRRQGKVVNELCFVRSIPKIGNVISVRHIGFSDKLNMRSDFVQRGAQELNHMMSLWQMNTGRADLFP